MSDCRRHFEWTWNLRTGPFRVKDEYQEGRQVRGGNVCVCDKLKSWNNKVNSNWHLQIDILLHVITTWSLHRNSLLELWWPKCEPSYSFEFWQILETNSYGRTLDGDNGSLLEIRTFD